MNKLFSICISLMISSCAMVDNVTSDEKYFDKESIALVAVATSVMNGIDHEGRYACATSGYACAGPSKGELGVMIMSRDHTNRGAMDLVMALGIRVDADLSEELNCAIIENRIFRKKITKNNPRKIVDFCHYLVNRIKSRSYRLYGDISVTSVCHNEDVVARRIDQSIAMLKRVGYGNCHSLE